MPLTILGDVKNLKRYGMLFKGADYQLKVSERMNILKTSYLKAMFEENSVYAKEYTSFNKEALQLINRVKRKFKRLGKNDLLYLHIAYNDILNWGYIYSDVHYLSTLEEIDTVLNNFNKMKSSVTNAKRQGKKLSKEEQIYLNFRKAIGDFYD